MRKITKVEDVTECDLKTFQFTFENGSTFEFDLLLDDGEWVLETSYQENRGIRLCESELVTILDLVKKLNERQRWK